jgi:hypothetical protein
VLECGAQATGGNYAFFGDIDARHPGFPLAEIHEDGSSVITKHPGTGGAVSVGTVTAQLLYEISGARYAGPDVTARFDTIELADDGPDRVRIRGVRGEAPPPTTKVCLNHLGGWRNDATFVLTGLDIEAKAELVREQLLAALPKPPRDVDWMLARTDREDADTEVEASALLRLTVKDADPKVVGRAFSGAAVELALASYPGFTMTAPPSDGTPYGVYTPAYVSSKLVEHHVVLPDGSNVDIEPSVQAQELEDVPAPELPTPLPTGSSARVPLGRVAGARSGDKGGDANIGVWVNSDDAWRWLANFLTVPQFKALLPETAELPVTRHLFPKLRAVNFVVEGLLGEGVSSSARFDPQGKGLGEWLRARHVHVPEVLL